MKSHYVEIIRRQEQIIKELKETATTYFITGFLLGVFISLLTITLIKLI